MSRSSIYRKRRKSAQNFKVGNLIFLKSSLSKEHARDLYIIDSIDTSNSENFLVVRKANQQLRQKTYRIKPSEALLVQNQDFTTSNDQDTESDKDNNTYKDIPNLNVRGLP